MKILIIGAGYLGTRCHESWEDSVLSNKRVKTKQEIHSSNSLVLWFEFFKSP